MRIGIPRALMYYEYYPLWKSFFEELGAETVLSDTTSRQILTSGLNSCVNEACLPVKIFHGHVENLKGKADYLFIPRLKSVYKKEFICPKFSGLPEMIKFSVKDLPPIIDTEVYLRKSYGKLKRSFLDAGYYLTSDRNKILYAADFAMRTHHDYIEKQLQGKMPSELLESASYPSVKSGVKVAVMGHIYNLYDKFVNMDIFKKLSGMQVSFVTPETLDINLINRHADTLYKKMFWSFGRKLIGSAIYLINNREVDGIIYIMSFGCGIDSFVSDLIEKRLKQARIPFLLLMIDEQTGEAGFDTRIEAFTDMLSWRNNADIPAYR